MKLQVYPHVPWLAGKQCLPLVFLAPPFTSPALCAIRSRRVSWFSVSFFGFFIVLPFFVCGFPPQTKSTTPRRLRSSPGLSDSSADCGHPRTA